MINNKFEKEGITFDDVLLSPAYSEILPNQAIISTQLTQTIKLNSPIASAAMDTVTEHKMAIAMAQNGGIGIIHKNMPLDIQCSEILLVKSKVVNDDFPNACLDIDNKLIVGAAIGVTEDVLERTEALLNAGADVLVLDSAHGHSKGIIDCVKKIKQKFCDAQIIAGNIATAAAARDLISVGVDALKVGIGPGSICTTRIIAGIGVPQITAIYDVASVAKMHNIPVIADGGIKYSGDIVKALAAGANLIMIGSIMAGCTESPGEILEIDGKTYKSYRGMGSLSAMDKGSRDRYFQTKNQKLVPEGIEGCVAHKGDCCDVLYQLIGGIRAGMGYCGTKTIKDLQENSKFIRISAASLKESHPHDVFITKDAPNYN